jgi:hypothetical protein
MNLSVIIGSQLRGTPCQAFSKDMKVHSGRLPLPGNPMQGLFSYPDLVVVCGAMQFHDQFHDVLLNPTVIIDVLCASIEAFDRGESFGAIVPGWAHCRISCWLRRTGRCLTITIA